MGVTRNAVLYDFFQVPGGAEAVTVQLAQALERADLYVALRDQSLVPNAWLQGLRCTELASSSGLRAVRIARAITAFQRGIPSLDRYETVVYSGIYAPLAIGASRRQKQNYLYCHTIPRFAYDLEAYYLARANPVEAVLLRGLNTYLRPRYAAAVAQMDRIFVNSRAVKKRLQHYLGYDAEVVYPPCTTAAFSWQGQDDYYLSLARLEDYKRVDLIVRAFCQMPDKKLIVASGGSEYHRLKRLAAEAGNIHFTGWLDSVGLQGLIGCCIATVYMAKDEDFGLSPVESMAAGKPVIAVAEGGLLETVLAGETGLLLTPEPTVESLIEAVCELHPDKAHRMRRACEQQARKFSGATFQTRIQDLVTS